MLCCKGAGGRYALDIGEKQTTRRQWKNPLHITKPESRSRQGWQACGNFAGRWHAKGRKSKHSCSDNRNRYDAQRDGFSRKKTVTDDKQDDGNNTNSKHEILHLVKLPRQDNNSLKEIVAPATDTKRLGN